MYLNFDLPNFIFQMQRENANMAIALARLEAMKRQNEVWYCWVARHYFLKKKCIVILQTVWILKKNYWQFKIFTSFINTLLSSFRVVTKTLHHKHYNFYRLDCMETKPVFQNLKNQTKDSSYLMQSLISSWCTAHAYTLSIFNNDWCLL